MTVLLPTTQPSNPVANIILIAHFAWATWMILGAVLAVLGYRWRRLWGWRIFRITHLCALAGTATTPFWADGICPLTVWEWRLRTASSGQAEPYTGESFIIHWIRDILFLDVDPLVLSLATGAIALTTLSVFILHPPWRYYIKEGIPSETG